MCVCLYVCVSVLDPMILFQSHNAQCLEHFITLEICKFCRKKTIENIFFLNGGQGTLIVKESIQYCRKSPQIVLENRWGRLKMTGLSAPICKITPSQLHFDSDL